VQASGVSLTRKGEEKMRSKLKIIVLLSMVASLLMVAE
jgi:hypothetical protein